MLDILFTIFIIRSVNNVTSMFLINVGIRDVGNSFILTKVFVVSVIVILDSTSVFI